jgi:hypothetical protein
MKMRKLLPVIILAVGSLFLLSGCDAMLDAIFQKEQITVDVIVQIPPVGIGPYYYDWYYGAGTVTLTLSDVNDGTNTTLVSTRTGITGAASHFVFPFTKLKKDTYRFVASYASYYYVSPAPIGYFYDPSNTLMTSVSMPYSNAGDSTGNSVNLYMYF